MVPTTVGDVLKERTLQNREEFECWLANISIENSTSDVGQTVEEKIKESLVGDLWSVESVGIRYLPITNDDHVAFRYFEKTIKFIDGGMR